MAKPKEVSATLILATMGNESVEEAAQVTCDAVRNSYIKGAPSELETLQRAFMRLARDASTAACVLSTAITHQRNEEQLASLHELSKGQP